MRNPDYYRNRNFHRRYRDHHEKRKFFGVLMIGAGILIMLHLLNFKWFSFELTWPVILIIIGAFIGLKNGFRNNAWWILILIGGANLIPEFPILGHPSSEFMWPAVLILVGLGIVLRPKRTFSFQPGNRPAPFDKTADFNADPNISTDDKLDIDITFGGRKEFITSKNFSGGFIAAAFGGVEINMMQADTPEPTITLEIKVSFGGIELIIPSHWELQNEMSCSFGSVEDERSMQTVAAPDKKITLLLKGSCSFGNVEIKSY